MWAARMAIPLSLKSRRMACCLRFRVRHLPALAPLAPLRVNIHPEDEIGKMTMKAELSESLIRQSCYVSFERPLGVAAPMA